MSDTFQDPEADFQYDEETNILRVGISFSLKEVIIVKLQGQVWSKVKVQSQVKLNIQYS